MKFLLTRARPARMAGLLLLAALGAPGLARPGLAQTGPGVRAGVSVDPDQFYFGGHYVTDPLADRLRFQPNIEVGLGDDITLVTVNVEFGYWIALKRPWQVYMGGGPAINIYNFENGSPRGRGDDSDVEGGFNILVGLKHRDGLFFELKVGALDSPGLKLGVGYTF